MEFVFPYSSDSSNPKGVNLDDSLAAILSIHHHHHHQQQQQQQQNTTDPRPSTPSPDSWYFVLRQEGRALPLDPWDFEVS